MKRAWYDGELLEMALLLESFGEDSLLSAEEIELGGVEYNVGVIFHDSIAHSGWEHVRVVVLVLHVFGMEVENGLEDGAVDLVVLPVGSVVGGPHGVVEHGEDEHDALQHVGFALFGEDHTST